MLHVQLPTARQGRRVTSPASPVLAVSGRQQHRHPKAGHQCQHRHGKERPTTKPAHRPETRKRPGDNTLSAWR